MIKSIGKNILIYGALFLGTLILLLACFIISAKITQTMIQKNIQSSAKYFQQVDLFRQLDKNVPGAKIDNYADCILFNIIYNVDSSKPLYSTISASYYDNPEIHTNESFLKSVYEKKEANTSYARYWHGSMVILRPLLLCFDIVKIRIIGAITLGILLSILSLLLIKKKHTSIMVFLWIGLICIHCWYIPFSIEYTTTFIVMFLTAILCVGKEQIRDEALWKIFFLGGMITCFVDFLTTETVTLLVPVALVLMLRYEEGTLRTFREELIFVVKSGISWASAYILMWAAKWTMASLVLGQNELLQSVQYARVRVSGAIPKSSAGRYLGAVLRNLGCLFPFQFAKTFAGVVGILIVLTLVLFCVFYLYRSQARNKPFHFLLLLVGVIPYVRYLALSNHSYLHYFFTYRAQLVSVICLSAILYYGMKENQGHKGVNYQWKK